MWHRPRRWTRCGDRDPQSPRVELSIGRETGGTSFTFLDVCPRALEDAVRVYADHGAGLDERFVLGLAAKDEAGVLRAASNGLVANPDGSAGVRDGLVELLELAKPSSLLLRR